MAQPSRAEALRVSTIRYGKFRARGIPAILAGSALIVLTAGTVRALISAAPALPDVLREATKLIDAVRVDRPRLKP
jgi:hypothetical protein